MWWEIYRRWTLWGFARRVRKHGWTGAYITDEGDAPSFAYSIGFWETAKAPEVILFGFGEVASKQLLQEAYEQIRRGELKLADFAAWTLDWGEGMPALKWRKVHPSQVRGEYFNVALWYRERRGLDPAELEAYQLFTTDANGKFPWEDGFDLDYRPEQTPLYLPYAGPPDAS